MVYTQLGMHLISIINYRFGALNIIYNLADLINKSAFGLVIWAAVKE